VDVPHRLARRIETGANLALALLMSAALAFDAARAARVNGQWPYVAAFGIVVCAVALLRARHRAWAVATGLAAFAGAAVVSSLWSVPPGQLQIAPLIGLVVLAASQARWLPARQAVIIAAVGTVVVAAAESSHAGGTCWWDGVPVSQLLPYSWLIRIPGLAAFRDAARLALLGLVGAALLAGSAVEWLRYHARPLMAGVAAVGLLEAGWSGSPGTGPMPTALPALDRPIAADHSGSIVLDIPFGLRGGLPLYGSRLATAALLIATADGHPRAISYTAWVPQPTIAQIARHPFFAQLVRSQEGVPAAPELSPRGGQISAAELAAARRDLRHLRIGWALVWPTGNHAVVSYLTATGFRFSYRADGVVVYRLTA
jgi:hypothetical protein